MMMTTTMMTMEPRLQFRLGPIPFIHSLSYKEDYFGSATSIRADSFQHNMVIECRSRPVIRCLPVSRRAEAAYKLKKYLWTRSLRDTHASTVAHYRCSPIGDTSAKYPYHYLVLNVSICLIYADLSDRVAKS